MTVIDQNACREKIRAIMHECAGDEADWLTYDTRIVSLVDAMADAIERMKYQVAMAHDGLAVGTPVEKASGYKWPGVVVANFITVGGKRRYVVECTVPDVAGALHIYSPNQIKELKRVGGGSR